MGLAVGVNVFEKLFARQFLGALDDLCQARVSEVDLVVFAAFAAEMEMDGITFHFDMFVVQRREAVGVVLFAYCSLPIRIWVSSSRRTMVASIFSRGIPRRDRSCATRSRMSGKASPNATIRPYFVSSRVSRHRGW